MVIESLSDDRKRYFVNVLNEIVHSSLDDFSYRHSPLGVTLRLATEGSTTSHCAVDEDEVSPEEQTLVAAQIDKGPLNSAFWSEVYIIVERQKATILSFNDDIYFNREPLYFRYMNGILRNAVACSKKLLSLYLSTVILMFCKVLLRINYGPYQDSQNVEAMRDRIRRYHSELSMELLDRMLDIYGIDPSLRLKSKKSIIKILTNAASETVNRNATVEIAEIPEPKKKGLVKALRDAFQPMVPPAEPWPDGWPTETYWQAHAETRENIVQFLERVWRPLIKAGVADRRRVASFDPSVIEAIARYTRMNPRTGQQRQLPEGLRFPTLSEVNDRILTENPDAIRSDKRLARIVNARLWRSRRTQQKLLPNSERPPSPSPPQKKNTRAPY
jgi:hypothetical protein